MRFNQLPNAVAGVYPVTLIATSASGTYSQVVKLTVYDYNGWSMNSRHFRNTMFSYDNGSNYAKLKLGSSFNGGGSMTAVMRAAIPTSDGIYTYKLVSQAVAPDEMDLVTSIGNTYFNIDSTEHQSATLKMAGGRLTLSIPGIHVYPTAGDTSLGIQSFSANTWHMFP